MALWFLAYFIIGQVIVPLVLACLGIDRSELTVRSHAVMHLCLDISQLGVTLGVMWSCLKDYKPRALGLFPVRWRGLWVFGVALCCISFPAIDWLAHKCTVGACVRARAGRKIVGGGVLCLRGGMDGRRGENVCACVWGGVGGGRGEQGTTVAQARDVPDCQTLPGTNSCMCPGFAPVTPLAPAQNWFPSEVDAAWASNLEHSLSLGDWITNVAYVAVVSFCAPIWEEAIFRGFLLTSLARYMPTPYAVALSSIMFAMCHFRFQTFLPLLVLGVIFSLVFIRTNNLVPPIILHSAWNL